MPRSFDSVFYGAAGTSTGGPSDDEFNRVSFLSHFEGSNNGVNNAFDDASASNHTITVNNTVTQGSFGPFARPDGEWGVSFDGDSDYLDANDGPTFGTGAFTIEFFVNLRTLGSVQGFFDARPDGANGLYPALFVYSNNTLVYYFNSGDRITSSETLSANTWYHIAVCRSGTSTKLFLDGTQVGSTFSDSNNYPDSGRMRVGTSGFRISDGFHVDGVISNLRVVNSALYTSNFTAPTGKLTAITNTKLLTCQSNRFIDNSADGLTMTPSGNTAVTSFGPFLTSSVYDPAVNGASASFGGNASGDGLTAADSSDFELGSGDFTLAMWVYPNNRDVNETNTVAAFMLHSTYSGVGPALGWSMFWQSDSNVTNSFRFMVNGTGRIYDAEGFFGRQWTYLTAVRTGNTLKLFINGVQKVSTSFADFNNSTTSLTIGCSPNWQSDVYKFNGKMSDVFICKGTAVYTSAFTPPTAPLTAITNTKLLLNMADGQAIDSAAQNNLTLYGNANTSTDQAKFGDTSLHLDGTGDYVEMPYSGLFEMGAGGYTVECFIKTSGATGEIIGAFNGSASPYKGWLFGVGFSANDGKLKVHNANASNSETVSSTATVNNNAWRHVAFSKAGQTLKFFIDGDLDSTHTLQYVGVGSEQNIVIGASSNPTRDRFFNGYIDELRLTKATRYTADFTAPSAPFPDKGQ